MAPHSGTLAWKIPWAEEPAGLQSMGLLESDTTEQLSSSSSNISKVGRWVVSGEVCRVDTQLFCDPMVRALPGSSHHGIFQARILEWVTISYSVLTLFTI